MAPYTALYGIDPYVGLEAEKLPDEIIKNIKTARQLYKLLGNYNN